MNGATVGFTDDDGKGEYDIKDVPHAMRLTNSGTFVHGNYWGAKSVFGAVNTSHGCVGLSDTKGADDSGTAAYWFYDQLDHRRRRGRQELRRQDRGPGQRPQRLEHGLGPVEGGFGRLTGRPDSPFTAFRCRPPGAAPVFSGSATACSGSHRSLIPALSSHHAPYLACGHVLHLPEARTAPPQKSGPRRRLRSRPRHRAGHRGQLRVVRHGEGPGQGPAVPVRPGHGHDRHQGRLADRERLRASALPVRRAERRLRRAAEHRPRHGAGLPDPVDGDRHQGRPAERGRRRGRRAEPATSSRSTASSPAASSSRTAAAATRRRPGRSRRPGAAARPQGEVQGGGANFDVDNYSVYGADVTEPDLGPLTSSKITGGRTFKASETDGKVAVVDSAYAKEKMLKVGSTRHHQRHQVHGHRHRHGRQRRRRRQRLHPAEAGADPQRLEEQGHHDLRQGDRLQEDRQRQVDHPEERLGDDGHDLRRPRGHRLRLPLHGLLPRRPPSASGCPSRC